MGYHVMTVAIDISTRHIYMYLLLGNSQIKCSDHQSAIQSFERAHTQLQHYGGRPLFAISLVGFLAILVMHRCRSPSLIDIRMEIR